MPKNLLQERSIKIMHKYFVGINTVDELRQGYKELLKKHHPDNGGNLHIMQEINAEYEAVFAALRYQNKTDGEASNEQEKEEDTALRTVLNQITSYNMEIEIIGSWIWCFDCYAYKDKLKALGFKYAPKKHAWTWHYGEYKRYGKESTLDYIRTKYGSQKVHRTSNMQYHLN